jgi:hypothetical protein
MTGHGRWFRLDQGEKGDVLFGADSSLFFMSDAAATRPILERIEDAMREIATLILALIPLDAVFTPAYQARSVLLLSGFGLLLFITTLLMERRRSREP